MNFHRHLLSDPFCFLMITFSVLFTSIKGQRAAEGRSDSVWFAKRTDYASDNPRRSHMDLFIDSLLRIYMQSPQNCGISIAVIKPGSENFYNYGQTRRKAGRLPDSRTIYEVGAVSNTFCGLLLAQAVRENKISVDDDIRKYLPAKYSRLTYKGKPVLVRHLIGHSSGLPRLPENFTEYPFYDSLNPFKNYNKNLLLDALDATELQSEPGRVSRYSVYGIGVLQMILEKVFEQSFEEMLQGKIIQNKKYQHTSVSLNNHQTLLLADGYNEDGLPVAHWHFGYMAAAGALHSSTGDLAAFLKYMMTEDEVPKTARKRMFAGKGEAAMGWFVKRNKDGSLLYWQNGGTAGFSSFCGFIREKQCGVVILANSGINLDYLAISILNFLQR
jgi:CubicO group peptidase (beta-lactamase class C family)